MPTSNIKKSDVPDPSSAKAKNIIISKLAEAMKQLEDYSSANNFSGKIWINEKVCPAPIQTY